MTFAPLLQSNKLKISETVFPIGARYPAIQRSKSSSDGNGNGLGWDQLGAKVQSERGYILYNSKT